MKIPNKRELQQTAFNHISDIEFMNLYRKCIVNHIIFRLLIIFLQRESFRKNMEINHET